MKNFRAIVIVAVVTGMLGLNGMLGAEEQKGSQRVELLGMVDQYIASCDAKATLRDSRSEVIQQVAALATMKGAYTKAYRDKLVDDMVAAGVDAKAYQVQAHINQRFFETVRPRTIASR